MKAQRFGIYWAGGEWRLPFVRPHRYGVTTLLQGDCAELIPTIDDGSIQAVVTSPPYAEQRKTMYGGVPEKDYPAWCVGWMEALKPKLTPNGSVCIVIAPHIKDGQVSDYVLRTRLALREAGWLEHLELVWHKVDAPPLARVDWPRRTYESVLWFSRSKKPYCNNKSEGKISNRIGAFSTLNRFGLINQKTKQATTGIARDSDVIQVKVACNARGLPHPAIFPQPLAENLIARFSKTGDTILDCFMGSGTSGLAAINVGRNFVGVELKAEYYELAKQRIYEAEAEKKSA